MKRALYGLCYRLLLAVAYVLSPFNDKIRRGLRGRRGLVDRARAAAARFPPGARPYWFHVASSGELEQALPILDALRRVEPDAPLVLTWFSPTAARALELERRRREAAGTALPCDFADFSPFDLPASAGRFLDALRPRAFVAIHREIWPETLLACRKRALPCFLFAAYVPKGARRWMETKWLETMAPWLRHLEAIGTTDEGSAERLADALRGPTAPSPMGDPRVERVLERKARQAPAQWSQPFLGQKVLLLASLWPEDLAALKPALERLLAGPRDLRLVLVPHEPHGLFVDALVRWLHGRNVPVRRWSEWTKDVDGHSALVVDGVGFLAELYRVASVVFVGGSFKGRVHNCLEPAAYGCPIVTGPHLWNSGEALAMEASGLLARVADGEAFGREVTRLLDDDALLRRRGEGLVEFLEVRRGAGERYASLLRARLAPPPASDFDLPS